MKLPPTVVDEAVRLYSEGLATQVVAARLGITPPTVWRWVTEAGIIRKQKRPAADFSMFPFTPHRAWLLGLLFGDGNIHRRGWSVRLTAEDHDIVENIRSMIGPEQKITLVGGAFGRLVHGDDWKRHASIEICSKKLVAELREHFGLGPAKTYTMEFPELADESLPHFVRGLLDSDGSWQLGNTGLRFGYSSASRSFVEDLREVLIRHVGASSRVHVWQQKGAVSSSITFGHPDDVNRIGAWLYNDSDPTMRCERKYQRWLERDEYRRLAMSGSDL